MTSSERMPPGQAEVDDVVAPQWWPDLLLGRAPSSNPSPFRPSVWSTREESRFQTMRVRAEPRRPIDQTPGDSPPDAGAPQGPVGEGEGEDCRDDEAASPEAPAVGAGRSPPNAEPALGAERTRTTVAETGTGGAPSHPAAGPASATPGPEPASAQALQDAYARGVADGQAKSRVRDEAMRQRQEILLRQLLDALERGSAWQAEDWSAPMKRLSLRLAEEIVRGELRHPPTVERLVEQGLQALGPASQRPVVRLHPEDLAVLTPLVPRFGSRCSFEAVPSMSRGSVEVAADDTVMQDLIENRLRALAEQLFEDEADALPDGADGT